MGFGHIFMILLSILLVFYFVPARVGFPTASAQETVETTEKAEIEGGGGFMSKVKGKFTEIKDNIKNKTVELTGNIKNKTMELTGNIKTKTAEMAENIKNKTSELGDKIKDKYDAVKGKFSSDDATTTVRSTTIMP